MKFDKILTKYTNKNELSEEDKKFVYRLIREDFDDDKILIDDEIHPLAEYDYKKFIEGCNVRTKGKWIFKIYKRKEYAGTINIKSKYGNISTNIIYSDNSSIGQSLKQFVEEF